MTVRTEKTKGIGLAIVASLFFIGPFPAAAQNETGIPENDRCVSCHIELGDEPDVALFFATDIHARMGISCADCHGGNRGEEDGDVAMSPEAGFIGAPTSLEIPGFCARCHSDPEYMRGHNPRLPVDQLTLYRTSSHGILNGQGDEKVATCVSCHGSHNTRPASEPKSPIHPVNLAETCGHCHSDPNLMEPYGFPHDQVRDYYQSVHWKMISEGGDLSAPTCNDCHGNHGALPPDVSHISGVCGQCHVRNRELFLQSPKNSIFIENDLPQCETCHGNHAIGHLGDEQVGLREGSVCADCHDDDGSDASTAITAMGEDLRNLQEEVNRSHALIDVAIQRGMYLTDAEFLWRDARQKLYEARTILHLFDADRVNETSGEGLELTGQVIEQAEKALTDYRFRRTGLLVATGIITLLAIALFLKIRAIEKK